MIRKRIICNLERERVNQTIKWGIQNHIPLKWMAILGEEVGEANQAVLENELNNYRNELIQVADVAIAAIESLDRSQELKESR